MESYDKLTYLYEQKTRLLAKLKELNSMINDQENLVLYKKFQILDKSNRDDVTKTFSKIEKKLTKRKTKKP